MKRSLFQLSTLILVVDGFVPQRIQIHNRYDIDGDKNRINKLCFRKEDDSIENGQHILQMKELPEHICKKKMTKFDIAWNERYRELTDFFHENGHSDVPYSFENKKLSRWVTNQRQHLKCGKISQERIDLLEQLDFTWNPRCTWDARFRELKAFSSKHGHCNVPTDSAEYTDLSRFVAAQRHQYKLRQSFQKGSLTDERFEALQSINFTFETNYRYADRQDLRDWEKEFLELQRYYNERGTSVVPASHPSYSWSELQRNEYKKWQQKKNSLITKERIKLLNSIGFLWRSDDAEWYLNYQTMKEHYDVHGSIDLHEIDDISLRVGEWTEKQISLESTNGLDEKKKNLLQDIGIVFDTKKNVGVKNEDDGDDDSFKSYLREINIHDNLRRTHMKLRRKEAQKLVEHHAELLMAAYEKKSLWGMSDVSP
ncbi:hypothetical protein CTEN210_16628 [Chaetoceros tenuissimus]|uniref:Helicase-associated domain-containing protein n=1 Tax=Chaetoceros tenuissimus TaxID=426638 RepID=A0AAD3HDS7_9STRA|nr:hypothetical protein CTEN210_16628 [Chaetoceros tenuissimus]